jgi:hypothetical protein
MGISPHIFMYRSEVTRQHQNHLSGDVAIAVPVAWQSVGFLIFGGVALGVLFLSLASSHPIQACRILSARKILKNKFIYKKSQLTSLMRAIALSS